MSSAFSIILHDTRLEGSIPDSRATRVVRTDASTSIVDTIGAVTGNALACIGGRSRASAASRGRLTIACHGVHTRDGHFFLQLGDLGLQLSNVDLAAAWRGYFRKIKVKACGTDNPAARTEMVSLYQRLARAAETSVIASDTRQLYDETARPGHLLDLVPGMGAIEFGGWEGAVWEFPPDGTPRRIHEAAD
jgi:hypothetical protein